MKMICHNCCQMVETPEKRADGAVRCPQCCALTYLPGYRGSPGPESARARADRIGVGWLGYTMVGLVVAITAYAFIMYRGHAQQWVLSRVLPEETSEAVKLVSFHCTNALPKALTLKKMPLPIPNDMYKVEGETVLSDEKQRAGLAYLVVELSVDANLGGVRKLADAELQEIKRTNPNFSMNEVWLSFPAHRWFKIVGRGQPLRAAVAHRETSGEFAFAAAWNSEPQPKKAERIHFTVAFEAPQKLAESGALSFQFKWKRPIPLAGRGQRSEDKG